MNSLLGLATTSERRTGFDLDAVLPAGVVADMGLAEMAAATSKELGTVYCSGPAAIAVTAAVTRAHVLGARTGGRELDGAGDLGPAGAEVTRPTSASGIFRPTDPGSSGENVGTP